MSPTLRWALFGVSVCAAVVSVAAVQNEAPFLGGDNSGYIALAHGLLTRGAYLDVFDPQQLPHTKYPPVLPVLLALLVAGGARTWASLKVAASVPTVIATGLTFLWAERRVGSVAATAVSIVFAFSAVVVYYSQWVLSDPLFTALSLGSLWAVERSQGAGAEDEAVENGDELSRPWLALGLGLAVLAYLTRSAGLPLIVALLGWLALTRRWRTLGVSAVAAGLPMLAWAIRSRGEGVAQYGTEFWLVNPYEPELGRIGLVGLASRIGENLASYALWHVPTGIVGQNAGGLTVLGVVVVLLAIAGWVVSIRAEIRAAELFFPLYAGLILVWPSQWGGDRFAMPLVPLLLVYAATVLRASLARAPGWARAGVPVVACVALLVPAVGDWRWQAGQREGCIEPMEEFGVWACHGPAIEAFVTAARWSSAGLPEGAAVLARKPRHFYLLSGHPSRAFAFSEDPAAHLELADRLGARYILLDQWDGLGARYVASAVVAQPGAFCYMAGFGAAAQGGAQLLGILPPEERLPPGMPGPDDEEVLAACPAAFYRDGNVEPEVDYSSSGSIPLLAEPDS